MTEKSQNKVRTLTLGHPVLCIREMRTPLHNSRERDSSRRGAERRCRRDNGRRAVLAPAAPVRHAADVPLRNAHLRRPQPRPRRVRRRRLQLGQRRPDRAAQDIIKTATGGGEEGGGGRTGRELSEEKGDL